MGLTYVFDCQLLHSAGTCSGAKYGESHAHRVQRMTPVRDGPIIRPPTTGEAR